MDCFMKGIVKESITYFKHIYDYAFQIPFFDM